MAQMPSRGASRTWIWTLAAAFLFLAALPLRYHELVGEDWSSTALALRRGTETPTANQLWAADLRFVVWLVSRNAYTLLNHPSRLFDAEPCYPEENALTLGEPGLTLGVLGIPAWALTGDPQITYYTATFATVWIGAFAMFLLVQLWTGNPTAGLAAGLLYGLHPIKTANVVHPYVVDTGWTVLAMFFATRLFDRGRLRDALGVGLCMAAQIGGSLYPLLGAAALAVPMLTWLAWSRGVRDLRVAPLLLALLIPIGAAVVVYTPYLERSATGASAAAKFYMRWSHLLPERRLFPGWPFLFLVLAGIALPLRTKPANPRWALLAGAACAAYLAAGGNAQHVAEDPRGGPLGFVLPNAFQQLSRVMPGLDMVRAPASLHVEVHLALGALAGLGAAALLARTPRRWSRVASALLLLVTIFVVLGPPIPGTTRRLSFAAVRLAPEADELELYRALGGNAAPGPIFDAPFARRESSEAVLHSAYHHGRTSACSASFPQAEIRTLRRLARQLPSPDAIRELAGLGFSSVVLRHPPQAAERIRESFAERSEGLLIERARANRRTAWTIDEAARRASATPSNVLGADRGSRPD